MVLVFLDPSEGHPPLNMFADAVLGCTDCLCACCCAPCDLTQQEKESEFREKERLMNGAVSVQQVHVQPAKMDGGMQYQAPQQQHYPPQQQMGYTQPQQFQQSPPQGAQPVYHKQ
jgi:hypothetical protein